MDGWKEINFKDTNMKKILVLIGIASLLFSSCITNLKLIVFDDSIPEEKTARLDITFLGTVTEYNGITVNWHQSFAGTAFQIPAGDTLLQLDVDRNGYSGENIMWRYNFQPQKVYILHAGSGVEGNNYKYGINVYTFNYGEKLAGLLTEHFVEFVPYLNVDKVKVLK
jgi:hypothetical protein